MTYDNLITLVKEWDNYETPGEPQRFENHTDVYCSVNSVSRSDYWGARTSGLEPEIVFTMHNYEYEGQKHLFFGHTEYEVIRTYATGIEELELVCERVKGQKHHGDSVGPAWR